MYVALADGNVGRALDSLRDGLLFGYKVQMDTLIHGLVGVAIDVELGRVAQRDIGHDADRRLELRGPPALELQHLDIGVVDGVDGLSLEGLAHDLRHHGLDHLLAQRGRTDPRLDQRARRPARPKALDLRARREAIEHAVVGRVDDLGRHLDVHADLALGQALGHD